MLRPHQHAPLLQPNTQAVFQQLPEAPASAVSGAADPPAPPPCMHAHMHGREHSGVARTVRVAQASLEVRLLLDHGRCWRCVAWSG